MAGRQVEGYHCGDHPTVDWHNHIVPPVIDIPHRAIGRWPSVHRVDDDRYEFRLGGSPYRAVVSAAVSPVARISDMNEWRIQHQVLSPAPFVVAFDGPPEEYMALAHQVNRFMADAAVDYPDRFSFFAMMPYTSKRAVLDTIARLEDMPGVRGVCLSAWRDDNLLTPDYSWLWSKVVDNGWLIFVHPADVELCPSDASFGASFGFAMPTATGRTAARILTSGLLRVVPGTQFVLAHSGGTLPSFLERLDFAWVAGMHPQLIVGPLETARAAFWVDTVAYGSAGIMHAAATVGWNRLVFGSDYPSVAQVSPARLSSLVGRDSATEIMARQIGRPVIDSAP